jgi:hypothetical protein
VHQNNSKYSPREVKGAQARIRSKGMEGLNSPGSEPLGSKLSADLLWARPGLGSEGGRLRTNSHILKCL